MIGRVVIVGGGTAGWMTAAALARTLGQLDIRLVESEAIGTIGVGEATVPPVREFNRLLGVDEDAFLAATGGTFKLGIAFEGWGDAAARYLHPFGWLGPDMGGVGFHHYLLRARAGDATPYSVEASAAAEGRFARATKAGPVHHAFHFDAARYAAFLRARAEADGVRRTDGEVTGVETGPAGIAAIRTASGERIAGDLFVDCTGSRALLIEGALGVGYDDWSGWLPCDRAVALPGPAEEAPPPYTRAVAWDAGWRWRIPLRHRTGNGLVYSSAHVGDDAALDALRGAIGDDGTAEPNRIRFRTGRRRESWRANCVAIGLSGGFLEPLESTSIHLIQTAIIRLLGSFPRAGLSPPVVARYNRDTREEYERIRDFVVAHYALGSRTEPFWRDVAAIPRPDGLTEMLEAFADTGAILTRPTDLFGPSNWYAVMTGQGLRSRDHHPIADRLDGSELDRRLSLLRARTAEALVGMPTHGEALAAIG